MIKVENINFLYENKKVLDNISFSIEKGEKVVLLGNNGCGKSTLFKILAGLLFANSGKYFYKNNEINKKYLKQNNKIFRKEVSFLFQDPNVLLFNESVREELEFSKEQFDLDVNILEFAEKFNIEYLLDKNPLNLSGGEKQKVALAIMFITNPELIILDEPASNLDPKSVGWLVDFLYEQKDLTTIISTHNLSLALELGEKALVIDENHKIIYNGNIEELFNNKDILLKANLIHKHKHRHNNIEHSHFHIHNWS